jgi:hypothetical protein
VTALATRSILLGPLAKVTAGRPSQYRRVWAGNRGSGLAADGTAPGVRSPLPEQGPLSRPAWALY